MRSCGGDDEIARTVERVELRQGAAAGFANLDGAIFVFLYTAYLLPDLDGSADDPVAMWADVLFFAAYLAVSVVLCAWTSTRRYRARTGWLVERSEATEAQRAGVLRLPFDQSLYNLVPWAIGAALFSGLSLAFGSTLHYGLRLAGTILLGGLVSVALSFLLIERTMRPLFALALGGEAPSRPATLGVRPRLLLTWALGSGVPLLAVIALQVKSDGADIAAPAVALAAAGIFIGLLATVVAARSVADPLDQVRQALSRVEEGDLDVRVPVDDGGEVGLLQSGVNRMVDGLRERRRLADLFGRHVGTEVANRALAEGAGLDSEQREASMLFVDVVGSTAMAEVLQPQDVVRTLNAFFGAVVAAVGAEGGWVNKFEGDGALCVFGAPANQPDHAARALRAARVLRERIEALADAHPGLDAAIGVSSGLVVAGNVGTEQRYEYTVIGRPVNEAARLSELAKARDNRVLASSGAIERAGDEARRWAGLGAVALRGQQAPTAIYEPAIPVPART